MSNQRDNGLTIQFENNKITSWFRERSEVLKTGKGNITVTMTGIRSASLIALCFLLTSTGWLSWEYHLLDQVAVGRSEFATMVIGYLLQAAGIAVYARFLHQKPGTAQYLMPSALILHMLCMFPAVLSPFLAGTLLFGFLMNFFCGIIAGYYLCDLTECAGRAHRASVFGTGYAAAILASWLLSLVDGGRVYYSEKVLFICLALTTVTFWVAGRRVEKTESPAEESGSGSQKSERTYVKRRRR